MIEFPSWELSGYICLASLIFWGVIYPIEMKLVLTLRDRLLVPTLNVIIYLQVLMVLNMIILKWS